MLSYNAIHGTNFEPSDITKIHADDLAVCDTGEYCYIMTYSFPCQDLSCAGRQRGMAKGTGTRSGLLWEVERLLREMQERPQILLMENVPQVVSEKFIGDFSKWLEFLESIGYTSKYEILNAKDYGVPQNRERCFMVSWQGDYFYDFPPPQKLLLRLKDMLEPEVDGRYYLSDKAAMRVLSTHTHTHTEFPAKSVTPSEHPGAAAQTATHGIQCVLMTRTEIVRKTDLAPTLMARDYKGFGNQPMAGVVEHRGGKQTALIWGTQAVSQEGRCAICPGRLERNSTARE